MSGALPILRLPATALRGLARRSDGTAVTEFGLIAPVFFMLMFGLYDFGHMIYARSVLNGAVERAARLSSLETADTAEADAMIEAEVGPILPGVDLDSFRTRYYDFADIKRPEQFDDENGDDICNNGEAYVDENRSGRWEADIGVADDNGGAGDVVVYKVTATYSPLFKIPFLPESWNERTLTASSIKKNQPFGNQTTYATTAGTCP